MAVINNMKDVLHRIRARLYPNYLSTVDGAYIARTDDETSLKIEDICSSMKERAGYTGKYEEAVEIVQQFFNEAMYRVCDGFSVNFGDFFTMHPRIGGVWHSPADPWDVSKHPIRFGFHVLKRLRDIVPHIEVLIEGVYDGSGFIAEITDVTTESVNETLTPGGMFALTGHKIKVSGTDPSCGVFFVDSAGRRVPVAGHLADNQSNRIVGLIPALGAGTWTLEVVSQFSGSSTPLKTPRTVRFGTELTVS
jgi:hypothetical protein